MSIITAILICLFSIPTFAETAPVYEKENNNVLGHATAIQFNVPAKGELADFSDVDWFSFNITKEGYFSLNFGPDDNAEMKPSAGWSVYLYDKERKKLKHFTTTDSKFAIYYISLAKGKYYIRIKPKISKKKAEKENLISNTPYTLLLQFTEDKSWIPDDSRNRAYKKADFEKVYHGTISRKEDRDLLYFQNNTSGTVSIDFEVDPSFSEGQIHNGWDIYVLNRNKKVISDHYWTKYDTKNPLHNIRVDGKFYVKVKPYSENMDYMPINCKYNIKVSFIKDPPKKIEKIKVKKIKVKKIKTNNKSIKSELLGD